ALLGAARSPEGLFYARIEPNGRGGYAVDRKNRSSAWPRLLAACLRFGAISGDSRFVAPAEEVLQGLPGIHARIWRNRPEILARDAPGILNLVALALRDDSTPGRPNLGRTLDWLDRESAKIRSALKDPSRSLKESHDGLFARATLAHAWFLSAGTRLVPWREDLVAGANVTGDTLDVVLQSEALWDGTLLFDSRGLRDPATLATDTAYEPGLPTRFPIEPGEDYSIQISGAGGSAIWNGTLLGQGLRVSVDPASGHHIRIVKLPSHLPPSPADTDADSTLTIEPQSPF
ncbi:MAG: hypothetical protein QGI83_20650, partial [Candidatus Latescibacteria bacterium]|nr:hypothetical protein [Candidatus Latescibacterota bacterium]